MLILTRYTHTSWTLLIDLYDLLDYPENPLSLKELKQ